MATPCDRRARAIGLLVLVLAWASPAVSQTDRPYVESADTHYYDFWPGDWYRIREGKPDTAFGPIFSVRQSVHPAAYQESWYQSAEPNRAPSAHALRGWDQIGQRWMFTWVSANGLFQVWEGKRVGDIWYNVKEFEVDGQKFLSRQAWLVEGPNQVAWVIERSTDGGATWAPRRRESYLRGVVR